MSSDGAAAGAGTGLTGTVLVAADPAGVAEAAARWLLSAAAERTAAGADFHVALAGGSTPKALYELLAGPCGAAADWDRWHAWFSDERAVSPEHEASNFRLARSTLLDRVPIDPSRVHRIEAEGPDLDAAAARYGELLGRLVPTANGRPRLDLVLLGLGENGHTASLFPGDPSLDVTDRLAVRARADYAPVDRITLTFAALNAAARVGVLAVGRPKAAALGAVVAGTVPAARLRPASGELRWFVDAAAATGLR